MAAEEEGDTIPFRRIAPRASSPQITITGTDPDIIRVEGNDFDQSFGGVIKNLSVSDGLVTGFEELAAGWWGTKTHRFENYIASSTITMVETYEAGILVDVTHSSGYISGDGTEGDPGVVEFVTTDTDT